MRQPAAAVIPVSKAYLKVVARPCPEKESVAMVSNGVDMMRFLPGALNVKVKRSKTARVNGGRTLTL